MNTPYPGGEVPWVEALYCRRCRRAVNTRTGPAGTTFAHAVEVRGGTVDHRPEPAPVTEIDDLLIECDFCSAPDAAWIYQCADQRTNVHRVTTRVVDAGDYRNRHHAARTRRTETEHTLTQAWGQRWSACAGCAELIESRDLYGLIARVVDALPSKLTAGTGSSGSAASCMAPTRPCSTPSPSAEAGLKPATRSASGPNPRPAHHDRAQPTRPAAPGVHPPESGPAPRSRMRGRRRSADPGHARIAPRGLS